MIGKQVVTATLLILNLLGSVEVAWPSFDIQSDEAVHLEIKGYEGLNEINLFRGELAPGIMQNVATAYRGLCLLSFAQGQVYPVILGNQTFLVKISSPDTKPSFTGSDENEYFYTLLGGSETGQTQYEFPALMIKAKQLLDSTVSIRTVDELLAMKETFHTFVRSHYQGLYHSDMLRRLIAQYFMMHEYIDYHVPGAPAADIHVRYQNTVMDGVRNWLDIINPNIPQHEILNYCVSLYYDRSMATIASSIMDNFSDIAYCPGDEESPIPAFEATLTLTNAIGNKKILRELTGEKLIAFVSDKCPVSKLATVIKARSLARKPGTALIVVPLQPLSAKTLAMQRMVSGYNMMFVDDEKWRKEKISKQMKLPRFIQIEDK